MGANHTAGQLKIDTIRERAVSVNYDSVVIDTVQSALTREECEANLAEAVHRWNAHEDLLKALVLALECPLKTADGMCQECRRRSEAAVNKASSVIP